MVKEFKNGIERLEYIVGSSIKDIEERLDDTFLPDSKRIIELRFGLEDGIEHTLLEVADILNKDCYSDEKWKPFFKDKDISKMYTLILGNITWSAETVRQEEARTLIELKQLFMNL